MHPLGNDRFAATFVPDQLGRWQYQVHGWLDHLGTWRHGMELKLAAGVDVSVDVPNAELSLDGRALQPGESRVPSGTRVLLARAPGHQPDVRSIQVPEGGHVPVRIVLDELHPIAVPALALEPPPVAKYPQPREGVRSRLAPLVLGGIALAGVGVGSVFGVRTFVEKAERDDHCPAAGCDPTGHAAAVDARTSATISTIAFGVGGAAGVASLLWLLLDRAPRSKTIAAPLFDQGAYGLIVRGAL